MGTKNDPGEFDCYDKAEPDEPMFVLLARDPRAALTVRYWASMRLAYDAKADEALECANAMDLWRLEYAARIDKEG